MPTEDCEKRYGQKTCDCEDVPRREPEHVLKGLHDGKVVKVDAVAIIATFKKFRNWDWREADPDHEIGEGKSA